MEVNEEKPYSDIHAEARERLAHIWNQQWTTREQCRQDRRIATLSGAIWEGATGEAFDNKPQFEMDKLNKAAMRIISDFRNNPITADFVSIEGEDSDKLAEVLDGLYRADEQDCSADEAYDNAFEEAVLGGFGAYRFTTEYEDDEDPENDKVRVVMEPIYDADVRVFFDLNAKKQSKSDAMFGFIITSYSRDAYKAEFNEEPSTWPQVALKYNNFEWVVDDSIKVAEYFRVEKKKVKYVWYAMESDKDSREMFMADELTEEKIIELSAMGYSKADERTITKRKVVKYMLNGNSVVGEPEEIAGSQIPIVPVYGKRWYIDGIERCAGHVRYAVDAQRLNNMQVSRLAEIASVSATAKPIVTAEQYAGHQDIWENDAIENYPVLTLNAMRDKEGNVIATGPIGHTRAPDIPPALAQLYAMTRDDLNDILGTQDGSEEIRSNVSKEVVEQIHARLDARTYIYVSNMAKAVARGGKIWLSMAKDIYAEDGRMMKTIDQDGKSSSIKINRPYVRDDKTIGYQASIADAKFNVHTKVAPASSSRKAATVRTCTNMMGVIRDEMGQKVLSLTAMMNMEGEGVSGLQKYARKELLKMGVVEPTEQEAQEMAEAQAQAAQKQDPQAIYLQAEAQKAQAQAEQAKANMEKAMADKSKAEAQTLAILAGIDESKHKNLLDTMRAFHQIGSESVEQIAPIQNAEPLPADVVR